MMEYKDNIIEFKKKQSIIFFSKDLVGSNLKENIVFCNCFVLFKRLIKENKYTEIHIEFDKEQELYQNKMFLSIEQECNIGRIVFYNSKKRYSINSKFVFYRKKIREIIVQYKK